MAGWATRTDLADRLDSADQFLDELDRFEQDLPAPEATTPSVDPLTAGAPLTSTFQGTTPQETAELCTETGLDPTQVFHLDGGQSSKIAYTREHRDPDVVGSLHYLQWPATNDAPFRWRGLEGRLLRSAVVITVPEELR